MTPDVTNVNHHKPTTVENFWVSASLLTEALTAHQLTFGKSQFSSSKNVSTNNLLSHKLYKFNSIENHKSEFCQFQVMNHFTQTFIYIKYLWLIWCLVAGADVLNILFNKLIRLVIPTLKNPAARNFSDVLTNIRRFSHD